VVGELADVAIELVLWVASNGFEMTERCMIGAN
jgi:hypothetical protein